MKQRTQRAVITLTDVEGGYKANVVYEPSITKRTENSPAANAAVRLSLLLNKHPEELGAILVTGDPKIIITDG